MIGPTRLLYIYVSQDDSLRQALESHLTSLAKEGLIEGRHVRLLLSGTGVNQDLAAEGAQAGVALSCS